MAADFSHLVNLASPHLGSRAVFASDEFFAPLSRALADSEPVFRPDVFDEHGKWMDGWETKRRRGGGEFDEGIIRLGAPGEIMHADIDTRHFTGNYPAAAQLCGCAGDGAPDEKWKPLVAKTELRGDSHNIFSVNADAGEIRWVRLRIYPDGGVARLRLYGEVRPDWQNTAADELAELSALRCGGRIVAYSDAHYGNVHALLSERAAKNMGDGWETRRRREPGNDWVIVALGHLGEAAAMVADTSYFRGNYPEYFSLQGARREAGAAAETLIKDADSWAEMIPKTRLESDRIHRFGRASFLDASPVNYVRLNIYPDGGVARFRLFGFLRK